MIDCYSVHSLYPFTCRLLFALCFKRGVRRGDMDPLPQSFLVYITLSVVYL